VCDVCRVLHRMDGLLKAVAVEAVQVTQFVCSAQNVIRRKFMSEMKRMMCDAVQVKKDWQQLIMQLTHERSVLSEPLLSSVISVFLAPNSIMLSTLYAVTRPSICLSVRQTGGSVKTFEVGMCTFHHTVATSL